MSVLEDKLLAAGLPVYSSDEVHTTFSRSLSDAEEALYMLRSKHEQTINCKA